MSGNNVVSDKSFAFAVRAVRCSQHLARRMDAAPIARQFLRAATSIGANLAEAQDAQSHADFIAKASIALKEARETDYWIRLMAATEILTAPEADSLRADCDELLRLLTSIVKTARARQR
jgi:four helix bundle protein